MKAGFALPSVLVVTATTCLALLAAVTAIEGLAASAREAVDRARFEERSLDIEARATFATLTSPITSGAIEIRDRRGDVRLIQLDGTPYATANGLQIALQDEAGLINLDTLPVRDLPRLFVQFGIAPAPAATMAARLADYVDHDDLVRDQGAEADAYTRAGLPPPPNQRLRSRADVLGVIGWADAAPPGAWRRARDLIVTDAANIGVNINTMPPAVLQVLYGLRPEDAKRAAAQRRQRPFATLEELGRAAGVRLIGDAERSVIKPAGRIRFTLDSPKDERTWSSRIILNPPDGLRPFVVVDRGVTLLTPGEKAQVDKDVAAFPLSAD